MSNPLSHQEGGSHYKNMKIQPVEFVHANNLPFIEGSVIKDTTRHKTKNKEEDIKKAIHFLTLLLHLEYGITASVSYATPIETSPSKLSDS